MILANVNFIWHLKQMIIKQLTRSMKKWAAFALKTRKWASISLKIRTGTGLKSCLKQNEGGVDIINKLFHGTTLKEKCTVFSDSAF